MLLCLLAAAFMLAAAKCRPQPYASGAVSLCCRSTSLRLCVITAHFLIWLLQEDQQQAQQQPEPQTIAAALEQLQQQVLFGDDSQKLFSPGKTVYAREAMPLGGDKYSGNQGSWT